MHNTQQSLHTNSTVYSPCKNNSSSTDSADSIFLPSSSVRPAEENDCLDGKMYSKMHSKMYGLRHTYARTPCPRCPRRLLNPSPRLNRELYPHTQGFPMGPAGSPLSPSPCSSVLWSKYYKIAVNIKFRFSTKGAPRTLNPVVLD